MGFPRDYAAFFICLCIPIELWREKIGDHINYLLLLTAVIEGEQAVRENTEVMPSL